MSKEKTKSNDLEKMSKEKMDKEKTKFDDLAVVKDFKNRNQDLGKELEKHVSSAREAWKILNEKNPQDWNKEDFIKLWTHKNFLNPITERIAYDNVMHLRKWMLHIGKVDLTEDPTLSVWLYKPRKYYENLNK